MTTTEQLQAAEAAHQDAQARAEAAREHRNHLVRQALLEGWTQADVSTATGLSRGRIGQLAQGLERVYREPAR
jgi:hypothetical protein